MIWILGWLYIASCGFVLGAAIGLGGMRKAEARADADYRKINRDYTANIDALRARHEAALDEIRDRYEEAIRARWAIGRVPSRESKERPS